MQNTTQQVAQVLATAGTIQTTRVTETAHIVRSYIGVLDLYAESIIGDRFVDYDGIEIHGVCDRGEGDDTCCEIDNVHPQFFSVYVHLREGGIDCVGDCEHYSQACEYANHLATTYKWPVVDAFKAKMQAYIESRTGEAGAEMNLVEPFITLSTGRTVFRRTMPNGAKDAFMLDGAFHSEAELTEYWHRMKHNKSTMN